MDPAEPFRRKWRARSGPALISVHRGLWGAWPENSLAAIAAAADLGIVEIDVQLSADGVPVVFHDDTLERMTEASGPLAARTQAELTGLRLRTGAGGPDAALTGHCIPSLAEVLEQAPAGVFFDFDAKHPHEVDAIAAEVRRLGGQALGSVKVDTETPQEIEALLEMQRRHGLMVMAKVMLPSAGPDHIRQLVQAGVAAAEVWFGSLDELSAACRAAGDAMAISTYTLDPVHCCGLSDSAATQDPDSVWGRLLDAGVTVIMTDRARELDAYLKTRDARSTRP